MMRRNYQTIRDPTAQDEQGYEKQRLETPVSKNYHCAICLNVFKDPVMYRNNEHLFCRAFITKHLENSRTCPSCIWLNLRLKQFAMPRES